MPPPADPDRYAGTYERASVRFEAVRRDDDLVLRVTEDDDLGSGPDRYDVVLTPLGGDRFAGRWPFSPLWQSFRFLRLDDGSEVLHPAGRATPRVG